MNKAKRKKITAAQLLERIARYKLKSKKATTTFNLEKTVLAEFIKITKAESLNRSSLVNQLISNWIAANYGQEIEKT